MMCMTIGSHDVPFASTRLGTSGCDPWCFRVFPPCIIICLTCLPAEGSLPAEEGSLPGYLHDRSLQSSFPFLGIKNRGDLPVCIQSSAPGKSTCAEAICRDMGRPSGTEAGVSLLRLSYATSVAEFVLQHHDSPGPGFQTLQRTPLSLSGTCVSLLQAVHGLAQRMILWLVAASGGDQHVTAMHRRVQEAPLIGRRNVHSGGQ